MDKFSVLNGIAAPMDRANIDTDMIIPKQFLKSIKRSGFGPNLFDELRYLDEGQPDQDCSKRPLNPDFVLNQARYQAAEVLLARANFGCGSSREHAPWALLDFGFKAVIAPSFADIFFNNCFKNGILPIVLEESAVEALFNACYANDGFTICIDLPEQTVSAGTDLMFSFEVDPFRKHCLINGLDDIGLTLEDADQIRKFEQTWQAKSPWLFADLNT
ncbi:MAG: 3-isopropylmalate dehydratase small subunit [Pseudomonadales bacterium]|nr:3-isopropylmalate dehydratase small subunit [Pseudomonadales bacterium]